MLIIIYLISLSLVILSFWLCDKRYKNIKYVIPFRKYSKAIFVKGYLNGKGYYFLVDSGASTSVLNSCDLDMNEFKQVGESTIYGANSQSVHPKVVAKLQVESDISELVFATSNLDGTFMIYKNECGVKPIGIIGNDFMSNNKWIIDYDNKVILKYK